jgi:hypothetical protein
MDRLGNRTKQIEVGGRIFERNVLKIFLEKKEE